MCLTSLIFIFYYILYYSWGEVEEFLYYSEGEVQEFLYYSEREVELVFELFQGERLKSFYILFKGRG